jgi:hypothetical protein
LSAVEQFNKSAAVLLQFCTVLEFIHTARSVDDNLDIPPRSPGYRIPHLADCLGVGGIECLGNVGTSDESHHLGERLSCREQGPRFVRYDHVWWGDQSLLYTRMENNNDRSLTTSEGAKRVTAVLALEAAERRVGTVLTSFSSVVRFWA